MRGLWGDIRKYRERDVIWMSRYTDHLFRKDAFTLTGILYQYPGYSGFVLCFLSVIFICTLRMECLEIVIEFNIGSMDGVLCLV
jgi:hypothetical protein